MLFRLPLLLSSCSVFTTSLAAPRQSRAGSYERSIEGVAGKPWLEEFQDVLFTMQTEFWGGEGWHGAIQWTGAVLNTLLAASESSLTDAIVGNNTDSEQISASGLIENEIVNYFDDIEAYWFREEADDIIEDAYDDIQWVVLEWLEVMKFLKRFNNNLGTGLGQEHLAGFAERALEFYSVVADEFDTSTCNGGIKWTPGDDVYKNAVTNELYISSSIGMYLHYEYGFNLGIRTDVTLFLEHDQRLLDNAMVGYEWFKTQNFKTPAGLIIDGFHMSEGRNVCNLRNEIVFTYNQGVILSGLRGLWEATGDTTYLDDGYALIDSVIAASGWNHPDPSQWAGLGRGGVLEEGCDAAGRCNQDQQMFKGIYFHHLSLFCEPLPTTTPLVPSLTHVAYESLADHHQVMCNSYIYWVELNARAALDARKVLEDTSRVVGGCWGADHESDNERGRGYKVEAQGSGLGVVKAAYDLTRRRDAWQSAIAIK